MSILRCSVMLAEEDPDEGESDVKALLFSKLTMMKL